MLLKKCVFRIFPTLLDILMRQKSTKFVGTLLAAGMIFSFAGMTVLSEAKAKEILPTYIGKLLAVFEDEKQKQVNK